uniref:DUF4283 domain-containing protein n=1 Tax=Cannabis sativa TaxID=3483 RepID=A0A803QMY2_CANSA
MKEKITLTDEEQTVFEFDFGEPIDTESVLDRVLYARILTTKKVWLSTLQRQMTEHWNGRFPLLISEDEDMFMLTFGCEGDKQRVLSREPFHFQNHHIVLYTPNVTP